jgi:chloramphenicol-sensitive protein RarD
MQKKGILYAIGAYMIWGLFPIYWSQLEAIPALQLIGHRIAWSFVLLFLFLAAARQLPAFGASLSRKIIAIYLGAGLLISTNWFTYVWAVTHGFVIEASLGYFINPLFSVFLGMIFFGERLRPAQWISIALAALGVSYLAFSYGAVPWIALVLATTFGLYGLVKKAAPLGSLFGLTLETGLLFVPAVIYLIVCDAAGSGAFLHTTALRDWLMVGAGLVTIVPLLLFAAAAPRVPLSTIGLLQYVNPSMQFLLGVLVYREPFTHDRLIGFGLVWLSLVLFWMESLYARRFGGGTPLPELGEG